MRSTKSQRWERSDRVLLGCAGNEVTEYSVGGDLCTATLRVAKERLPIDQGRHSPWYWTVGGDTLSVPTSTSPLDACFLCRRGAGSQGDAEARLKEQTRRERSSHRVVGRMTRRGEVDFCSLPGVRPRSGLVHPQRIFDERGLGSISGGCVW
jgi:hypothetical protein